MNGYRVRECPRVYANAFIEQHHYTRKRAPITKLALELRRESDNVMVGVVTLGYGLRPEHTIKRLFPSLRAPDYLEIGRLCILDSEPRNTESQFLSAITEYVRREMPQVKLLFSWADGIRGKPGFIYQAANFLYGGFIVSETYYLPDGQTAHPKFIINQIGKRDAATTESLGLTKVKGKQFRYVYFLCWHKERKRLLKESTVPWNRDYPKKDDCVWYAGKGSRVSREPPRLEGQVRSLVPASADLSSRW